MHCTPKPIVSPTLPIHTLKYYVTIINLTSDFSTISHCQLYYDASCYKSKATVNYHKWQSSGKAIGSIWPLTVNCLKWHHLNCHKRGHTVCQVKWVLISVNVKGFYYWQCKMVILYVNVKGSYYLSM